VYKAKFPTLVIDDFYDNPDEIVDYAMSQEFTVSNPRYPGNRTETLDKLNPSLYDQFCKRLFSIYYDTYPTGVEVHTGFQLIPQFDSNPDSLKNKGWIHLDGGLFAGVIYLNKDAPSHCGTSIYMETGTGGIQDDKYTYYNGKFEEGFDDAMKTHYSAFTKTMRIDNQYNRLISFDGSTFHGADNYHTGSKSELRLTQVFFVTSMETKTDFPLTRGWK
jgi:hypothetical protein